jgi:hypothetical protein
VTNRGTSLAKRGCRAVVLLVRFFPTLSVRARGVGWGKLLMSCGLRCPHPLAAVFPSIAQSARTLRHDIRAAELAITTPWNNGPIEGQINRQKTIKRQMYGRAGFELASFHASPSRRHDEHTNCGRTDFRGVAILAVESWNVI